MAVRAATLLMLCGLHAAAFAGQPDLAQALEEAQRVSYQAHWSEAQAMLDELAPRIDPADVRTYADFHLLEARHLVLADRSPEGLERAVGLLELDLPDDQRLRALQFAANIGVLLRQYESAFEFLGEALAIDPDADNPAARAATLNMAAYMFGRVDEFEAGIGFGEEALALARQTDNRNEACIAQQRLAPVYRWAGRMDRAEATFRQGIADCSAVGNELFVGVLQHGLANLLREQQPEEALSLAEEAVATLQQAVYPLGEFEARMVRAEVLYTLDRLEDEGLQELERLSAYFAERELWDQTARLELLQTNLAEQSGHLSAALQHLRGYLQARENFLGRERAIRLAYLQVEFESRLQRQELDLMRETARVAQLEADAAAQERQTRNFALLSLGLALLLALMLLLRALRSRLRFRELSRQDRLSGLVNHSWFFEQAQTLIAKAERGALQGHLVLVAADIDHFKQVNDIHGHRTGDEVIGRTARRLREVFPDDALVGRIGGEEFAALVAADELSQVLEWIERFRAHEPDLVRAGDPEVTLSFGLACYQPGDDIEQLRERADQALYQAKRAGRDCYRLDESCAH